MNNLKLLREIHGLTQAEMGQKLGVSAKAYSLYELGKRDFGVDKALVLCEFYDVTLAELMGAADLNAGETMSPEKQRRQALVILRYAYRLQKEDMEFVQKFITLPPKSRKMLLKAFKQFSGENPPPDEE